MKSNALGPRAKRIRDHFKATNKIFKNPFMIPRNKDQDYADFCYDTKYSLQKRRKSKFV